MTVNYRSKGEGTLDVHFPLCALNAPAARGDEDYVARVKDLSLTGDQYALLNGAVKYVGVTPRFRDVIRISTFPPARPLPASVSRAPCRLTVCWRLTWCATSLMIRTV